MFLLSEKETLGVYLLLVSRAGDLDASMARLRKRMEDALLAELSVGDFEDLQALYERTTDRPAG